MGSGKSASKRTRRAAVVCALVTSWLAAGGGARSASAPARSPAGPRPNIVLVLADQWRFEAFGHAGNPDVQTPNLDRLAGASVRFLNAVSSVPVCTPTRASLLTGQRALTHGCFLNDVSLNPLTPTLAEACKGAGYDTAYIGKWHVDGHGRSNFIPRERRHGFDYWKVLECSHNYTNSVYYADDPSPRKWDGYDAAAQTRDACLFLSHPARQARPFLLVLAWGPPHDPYGAAPPEYRALYRPERLSLRANVPAAAQDQARRVLAGYYAHCTALDACLGELRATLDRTGLARDTILVFTSDHGDMAGSQGLWKKQKPYDESIRVPLLVCWPEGLGQGGRLLDAPIASEDLMPTLLGLAGVPIPTSAEGLDYSGCVRGGKNPGDSAALIACIAPFGEWERAQGGKEYRGLRTSRYTYVRDLNGPWLLFDNATDPCQLRNLAGRPEQARLQAQLDRWLGRKLRERGDKFLPAAAYIERWKHPVDAHGTVPYRP